MVRELRTRKSFVIHTFSSGAAAREALHQTHFDLLIAEKELPDVDGLTLIREMHEHSPQTVTVLTYTLASSTTISEAMPAHHYLLKPFTLAELVNTIDSIFPRQPAKTHSAHPLVHKVILGGDASVGKSTLIKRYCTGEFDPTRAMTIGVDFQLYDLETEGVPTRLSVWDLGGQERFAFIRRGFYRGACAVGLVFDASNRTSFYNLMNWSRETREYLPDAPVLLVANKIDLTRQINSAEGKDLAEAWNVPYFETSCVSGAGVSEFFKALAYHALKHTQKKIESAAK
jgi:small GTP-binding protein